jgi:hypothetical protein
MASRESFSIKNYWKFMHCVPKRYIERKYNGLKQLNPFIVLYIRFYSVGTLLLKVLRGNEWQRKMFWQDSFRRSFYKHIGCKFIKHDWYYMDDEEEAFCTKCHKKTGHISSDQWKRMKKLKSIKKRIK